MDCSGWVVIIAYGLGWGSLYFFDFEKMRQRVLANPSGYSNWKVRFFTNLTFLKKAILSFFIALVAPVIAIFIMLILGLMP